MGEDCLVIVTGKMSWKFQFWVFHSKQLKYQLCLCLLCFGVRIAEARIAQTHNQWCSMKFNYMQWTTSNFPVNHIVFLLKINEKKNSKTIQLPETNDKLTKKYKALANEKAASIRQTIEIFLVSDKNSSNGPRRVDSITIVYGDDNVNPYILINSVDWSWLHLYAKFINSWK